MTKIDSGIIYLYTNLCNNKKYVGLTTKPMEERHRNHVWQRGNKSYFHNAIKKYGIENFKLEIIDHANTFEELKEKEKYWISFYDTFNNGYNLTYGGDGVIGYKHSEESLEKLRKANLGENNNRYGTKLTKEAKEKLRNSILGERNHNYGHPLKETTKAKLREGMLGRFKGEKNPQYDKKHSDETKQKMKESHACFVGGKHPQAIAIVQLNLNGDYINEFPSTYEASKASGADRSHIIKCCKNNKRIAKGFKWMYKSDYELLINK